MFNSSLLSFVLYFLFIYVIYIFTYTGVQHEFHCLSFCSYSFGHYIVFPSSIYGYWLPLVSLNFSWLYKKQEELTLHENLGLLKFYVWSMFLVVLSFCVCLGFFVSLRSVSCAQCCQCLWIVNSWVPFRFSLTFIGHLDRLSKNFAFCDSIGT
jgi:hypothetical protein